MELHSTCYILRDSYILNYTLLLHSKRFLHIELHSTCYILRDSYILNYTLLLHSKRFSHIELHYCYILRDSYVLNYILLLYFTTIGTFARRQGVVCMDLTFTNRAMQAMGGFAIQFNKNSFGIAPSVLQMQTPLSPNSSAQTSLQLTTCMIVLYYLFILFTNKEGQSFSTAEL